MKKIIACEVEIPFYGAKIKEVKVYWEGMTNAKYVAGIKTVAKIIEVK